MAKFSKKKETRKNKTYIKYFSSQFPLKGKPLEHEIFFKGKNVYRIFAALLPKNLIQMEAVMR